MMESLFHLRLAGVGEHPLVLKACFLGSSGVLGPWVAGLQCGDRRAAGHPLCLMVLFSFLLGLLLS